MVPASDRSDRDWPRVGVIILTHNGATFIKELLDSLEDQSYPAEKMEVVVVDNSSTDATRELVAARPGVRLIVLEENLGYAAGNNAAARLVEGDYLAFLNQDVVCHRDWLTGLMAALMDGLGVGVVTSNMVMPGCREYRRRERVKPLDRLYYVDLSIFGYGAFRCNETDAVVRPRIISGCAFLIRRQTIADLGELFCARLRMYVEDTDLSLRLRNLGLEVLAVRDSVVYHLHDAKPSLDQRRLAIGMRAIMNRVYVFFKNMSLPEFLAYLPVLALGGPLKIFELPLTPFRRALYFVPFAVLSLGCMAAALCTLGRFREDRAQTLARRAGGRFFMLRQLMGKTI